MDAEKECVISFNEYLRNFISAISVVFPECKITANLITKLSLMEDDDKRPIDMFIESMSPHFNKKGEELVEAMCSFKVVSNLGFDEKWKVCNAQQRGAIVEYVTLLVGTAQSKMMMDKIPSGAMGKISALRALVFLRSFFCFLPAPAASV